MLFESDSDESIDLKCYKTISSEFESDNDDSRNNFRREIRTKSNFREIIAIMDRINLDNIPSTSNQSNDKIGNRSKTSESEENSDTSDGGSEKDEIGKNIIKYPHIVRELHRAIKRIRIIHDVVAFKNRQRFYREIRRSMEPRKTCNILIFAEHCDHLHIIHDCTYTEGRCRYNIITRLRSLGRKSRQSSLNYEWTISQYICRNTQDTSVTLKSVGESGYKVVKLEIDPFNQVCNLPKEQWWKKASVRSLFLTSSNVNLTKMILEKTIVEVAKKLKKINAKKETKRISSYYGYNNSHQAC